MNSPWTLDHITPLIHSHHSQTAVSHLPPPIHLILYLLDHLCFFVVVVVVHFFFCNQKKMYQELLYGLSKAPIILTVHVVCIMKWSYERSGYEARLLVTVAG